MNWCFQLVAVVAPRIMFLTTIVVTFLCGALAEIADWRVAMAAGAAVVLMWVALERVTPLENGRKGR